MNALVFDATALSHFARANRMTDLYDWTDEDRRIVPAIVLQEIASGVADYPALGNVPGSLPMESIELEELDEVVAFARYKGILGGGPSVNNGEAAVLAWAKCHDGIALIDEYAARALAVKEDITAHGSLWLIIRAYNSAQITRPDAEQLVDDLLATDMRLPVASGEGLFAEAFRTGLLP